MKAFKGFNLVEVIICVFIGVIIALIIHAGIAREKPPPDHLKVDVVNGVAQTEMVANGWTAIQEGHVRR